MYLPIVIFSNSVDQRLTCRFTCPCHMSERHHRKGALGHNDSNNNNEMDVRMYLLFW